MIPGGKLCAKVILEGTRLTFKTEIAFALNEHPRVVGLRKYRYHSPVISAEWCAFTNVPWGRGLINFAPEEEAMALETYRTWARLFELLRYYSWIVDRFHISTMVWQWRERRLAVSGNPRQYDDPGVFLREQEAIRELVRGSRLPALELDVTDNDVPGSVERSPTGWNGRAD